MQTLLHWITYDSMVTLYIAVYIFEYFYININTDISQKLVYYGTALFVIYFGKEKSYLFST